MRNISTLALLATPLLLSGCQQLAPKTTNPSVQFVCRNGDNLLVKFDNDQQQAIIHYHDQKIVLPQQVSASGFHYANGQQSLRGKGNKVTATLSASASLECVAYP